MQYYSVQTTIDITKHDQGINSLDDHSAAQQQNFNTLLQGIGLRANVFWDNDPVFDGKHWHWSFYVESEDVFDDGGDPAGLLKKDLHNVPVIGNLSNPIAVYPAAFRTLGKDTNTWIDKA
jgi:hypothetical protein